MKIWSPTAFSVASKNSSEAVIIFSLYAIATASDGWLTGIRPNTYMHFNALDGIMCQVIDYYSFTSVMT